LETTSYSKDLRKAIQQWATAAPIERHGRYYHGDPVKSSLVATRVFFVPFISLLFFGIVISKSPAPAVAQSVVPDDVKHDTPGQVIKQGQSVHIDVASRLSTLPSPFTLAPKTSRTVSFPFKVPTGVCPGTYSITATTHANSATGTVLNTSTATLTITAH
jgi:hypothetical protein